MYYGSRVVFVFIISLISPWTDYLQFALAADEVELTPFPNSKYLRSNVERSFKDALLECHAKDLRLLSLDDADEKLVIENLLKIHKDPNFYWTSGTDLHSELRFVWSAAGKSVDIVGLEGNLKNFLGAGHCIQTVFANKSLHLLLEVCEKKFLFICEERVYCGAEDLSGQSLVEDARAQGRAIGGSSTDIFKEGTIKQHNNVTYFVSKNSLKHPWNSAYAYCKNLGMQLWSIETEEENKLIESIPDAEQYWTSGTDMGDHGNWMWMSTGEELGNPEEAPSGVIPTFSWTQWGPGMPKLEYKPPKYDDQHCLCIHKQKLWEDDWCSTKKRFICEPSSECS